MRIMAWRGCWPNRFVTEMKSLKRVAPRHAKNWPLSSSSWCNKHADLLRVMYITAAGVQPMMRLLSNYFDLLLGQISHCWRSMGSQCDFLTVWFSSSVIFFGNDLSLIEYLQCWRCWLGVGKSIRMVKIWVMRRWHGYPLEWSANSLHMVQLMPLLPHHLCFSKIQNGLSWYWLTRVVPDKGSQNGCGSSSVVGLLSKFFDLLLFNWPCF